MEVEKGDISIPRKKPSRSSPMFLPLHAIDSIVIAVVVSSLKRVVWQDKEFRIVYEKSSKALHGL